MKQKVSVNIPPHFGEELDSSWHHISRQKIYVIILMNMFMNSKIGWHARASSSRGGGSLSLLRFLTMAISQHLKSLSFTTYRLKCNLRSW
jgi:hypothetical protein